MEDLYVWKILPWLKSGNSFPEIETALVFDRAPLVHHLHVKSDFFFVSDDLHILQIKCITNKNITKYTIWKTKQHRHWTLCTIIKSNKVLKQPYLSITNIHQIDWE